MKTIEKSYLINASQKEVYDSLTQEDIIASWSGSQAKMETSKDGVFELWGGGIHGINKLISIDKIIQDWKEQKWNHYSRVTFLMQEKDGNTRLDLLHENIPDESYESIDKGWDEYYLGPLKDFLEK